MTRPDDLLAFCFEQLFERHPQLDKTEVGDVVAGVGVPEGPQGMNIARMAAMLAGMPTSVPGVTVNRFCSSGSQAVAMAAHQILQEGLDFVIGCGVESIS